ncbi:RadC-like JAB domain-containing protein [Hamiltosporidium magnivora]|uniref:RadC-like JAB domain-containing protein n=1 Tax=Hamiltosporidium magnivora TaxID=148818 RepID=A0A4Q9KRT9_9MICR|nr:RadC-like JAB domain-containing protein [Hamiltosporidium magnivora]
MSFLQDKTIEQAYAIHIDKNNKETIQMLSIGGTSSTTIDFKVLLQSAILFGTKKLYLIHNHPSGGLEPSEADINMTKKAKETLSILDIELEHIIINTFKNCFCLIDKNYEISMVEKEPFLPSKKKLELTYVDTHKLLNGGPVTQIKSSKDSFNYIQQKRFSAFKKNGAILLNLKGMVVGNYLFKEEIDVKEMLKFISKTATVTSVILYTNENSDKVLKQIKKIPETINVLDVIQIDPNENVNEYYYSYSDYGLLNEHIKSLKENPSKDNFKELSKKIIASSEKENDNNNNIER